MNFRSLPNFKSRSQLVLAKDQMGFAYAQAESDFCQSRLSPLPESLVAARRSPKRWQKNSSMNTLMNSWSKVARSTRRRKEVIRSLDEKSFRCRRLSALGDLDPEYVNESRYTQELFHTILAYAYKGEVVILGRGANFVTPFCAWITSLIGHRTKSGYSEQWFEGPRDKAKRVIKEVEDLAARFVKQALAKTFANLRLAI